jgi:hypothetical protein
VDEQLIRKHTEKIQTLPPELQGAKYIRKSGALWLTSNAVTVSAEGVAYVAIAITDDGHSILSLLELKKVEAMGWTMIAAPFTSTRKSGKIREWKVLRKNVPIAKGPVSLPQPHLQENADCIFFFVRN